MGTPRSSRREFLSTGASAVGAAWAVWRFPAVRSALAEARDAAVTASGTTFQFFTPEEAADIAAITAQLWPADDTPAASELGVPLFVDRVFAAKADGSFSDANFYFYDGPIGVNPVEGSFAPLVRDGLADLATKHAARFSTLAHDSQIAALTAIEAAPWFLLLRRMTIVGLFADPSYGGNAHKSGWQAIGFEDRFIWQPPFGAYDR